MEVAIFTVSLLLSVLSIIVGSLMKRLKNAERQITYLNESSVGTYKKEEIDRSLFPSPSRHLRGNSRTTFLASKDDVDDMTTFLNGKIIALEEHLKLQITQVPTEQKKFTVSKRK